MGADINLNQKITLKHRKQNPKESFFSFTPTLTHGQTTSPPHDTNKTNLPTLHPFRPTRGLSDNVDHCQELNRWQRILPFLPPHRETGADSPSRDHMTTPFLFTAAKPRLPETATNDFRRRRHPCRCPFTSKP